MQRLIDKPVYKISYYSNKITAIIHPSVYTVRYTSLLRVLALIFGTSVNLWYTCVTEVITSFFTSSAIIAKVILFLDIRITSYYTYFGRTVYIKFVRRVYTCIHAYTCVYICIHVYTRVYMTFILLPPSFALSIPPSFPLIKNECLYWNWNRIH